MRNSRIFLNKFRNKKRRSHRTYKRFPSYTKYKKYSTYSKRKNFLNYKKKKFFVNIKKMKKVSGESDNCEKIVVDKKPEDSDIEMIIEKITNINL